MTIDVSHEELVKWHAENIWPASKVIQIVDPFKFEFPKSSLLSLNSHIADIDRKAILKSLKY